MIMDKQIENWIELNKADQLNQIIATASIEDIF